MAVFKTLRDLNLKLGRDARETNLDPIPRVLGRRETLSGVPAFFGYDLWNAYEVSFLLPSGKPVVYHMQVSYPARTPNMVESKSFKLFLNAQNNRTFENRGSFAGFVQHALSQCVDGPVTLSFFEPDRSPVPEPLPGLNIDNLDFSAGNDNNCADLPAVRENEGEFAFYSHLLRSQCPVTHQPDWGSLAVRGYGPAQPVPESLLAYLISYRNIQDFHETCCERIFVNLFHCLKPTRLEVTCYFTRRGGLDINPHRSTHPSREKRIAPVWRQ